MFLGAEVATYRNVSLALCFSLLSGCSSFPVAQPSTTAEISKPPIGRETLASVGSPILEQGLYTTMPTLKLDNEFEVTQVLIKVRMARDEKLLKAMLGAEPVACSIKKTYIDPIVGPYGISCLHDRDGDGAYEIASYQPSAVRFFINLPTPVTASESPTVVKNSDSYRFELLYEGHDGSGLKLRYREYFDDMARPAFTQEATYPIGAMPMKVKFKNAEIDVLELLPSELRYVLRSGL